MKYGNDKLLAEASCIMSFSGNFSVDEQLQFSNMFIYSTAYSIQPVAHPVVYRYIY